MLGNLFPDVDPRFKSDRKGNPIEQSFAVARGELSEGEVFGLVSTAGVNKEFDSLPDKLKLTIVDGLSNLWKIDRVGRSVEEKDKKIVGSVNEMKHLVEENSGQIKRQYHSATLEWLPHSVNSLVKAALEKDSEKRRVYKDGVMSPPDGYIRKLNGVGYDYRERRTNIPNTTDRERVDTYLTGARDSDLGSMRSLLFQKVAMVVAAVEPISENSAPEG